MARIDLKVPFAEKDETKSLGAKCDPSVKTWYTPEGVDIGTLARWLLVTEHADLEQSPEFCVRAPFYYVIESVSDCWGCSNFTRVAILVTDGSRACKRWKKRIDRARNHCGRLTAPDRA